MALSPVQTVRPGGQGRRSAATPWILVAATALYLIFIARTAFELDGQVFFSLFDDAMISMRYARNLVEGHGLTFNQGSTLPPVEGYSNLAWTLSMAVLHLLPVGDGWSSLLVMLGGVVILIGNLWVLSRIALVLMPGDDGRLLANWTLVLAALYYPLVFWTLRGTEVGLITFLVYLGIWLSLCCEEADRSSQLYLLAGTLSLLTLARDDTVVPVFVIIFAACISKRPRARQVFLILVSAVAITKAAHTGFRLYFYDDWLPNTYYLKLAGIPLVERLERGFDSFVNTSLRHLFPLFAAAGLYLLEHKSRARDRKHWLRVRVLFALVAGQILYSVYVGGDAWEWMNYSNRYITVAAPALLLLAVLYWYKMLASQNPMFPCLAKLVAFLGLGLLSGATWDGVHRTGWSGWSTLILLGTGLVVVVLCLVALRLVSNLGTEDTVRLTIPSRKRFAVLSLALFTALVTGPLWAGWMRFNAAELSWDIQRVRAGLAIRECTASETQVGVICAGATPYFSRRPTVDLLGKTDKKIARSPAWEPFIPGHNKLDPEYSLGVRKPDLVVLFRDVWRDVFVSSLAELGYEDLGNGLYRNPGSSIDGQCLTRLLERGNSQTD